MTSSPQRRFILIASIGTSPGVLTNVVWALAHQAVPVIPDEVVVLMTNDGKESLRRALFEEGVWDEMLSDMRREKLDIDGKLIFGETSIRSIPDVKGNEIDDLRTGDDNLRAADFMLGELRKYTEDNGTELHVSIAGGRKTMSALLFSCMSLLGREQDKVYHVLLPPALEGGVTPTFFYPKRGTPYTARVTGKKHKAKDLQCELFEVPFVRMRGWCQEKFKNIPPSYRTLISKVQTVAPPAVVYPEIEIDAWNGWVKIDGKFAPMSKACFAMLLLLADGCQAKDLHRKLLALHKQPGAAKCDWLSSFQEGSRFADENCPEDVYKVQSELRKKLKSAGFSAAESLVPQRGAPVTFPLRRMKWWNRGNVPVLDRGCTA
jgi:CRISPR-associated protein (TIGR02584 family)